MNIRVPITSTDTTARRVRRQAALRDRAHRPPPAPGGRGARHRALADRRLGPRHDRAPRPADPQRAGRDRADQAPDRDPHPGLARGGRAARSRPRPGRRAQLAGQRQRGRPRAPAPPARPQERLPGAPHARPSRVRRGHPGARRRDPRGDPGGAPVERRRSPQLRLPPRPQLPPLLRRPDGLALGHLDADRRRDLADPQPDRLRRRGRPDHRAAVPADAALRRLGRPARRPDPEAPPADRHPGLDGDPRDRPLRRHRDRRRHPLDGLPGGLRDGQRQRRRQPDPAELRDRDGRARTGSSTRSASTASSSRPRGSSGRRSPAC